MLSEFAHQKYGPEVLFEIALPKLRSVPLDHLKA